ncbi:hypothetical protein glysoja_003756 [Glycine soja]|nr:hypothetical protein glysoja_003756 [Glycine soja]
MSTSPSGSTLGKATAVMKSLNFYLSDHPAIVTFRWSHDLCWGSTWSFLFSSIAFYVVVSIFLHLTLAFLLRRGRPVPLGPIPALHSLSMSVISVTIFADLLVSAATEIKETRTVLVVLRRRKLVFFQLFYHAISTFMSFLWLEFSQSFQVLAILFTTLAFSVMYGYRFWTSVAARGACLPLVLNCQIALLGCNLVCHVAVLLLHFLTGGCNGIGAWVFNSVLNGAILLLFLNFYVRMYLARRRKRKGVVIDHRCENDNNIARSSVLGAGKEPHSNKVKSN